MSKLHRGSYKQTIRLIFQIWAIAMLFIGCIGNIDQVQVDKKNEISISALSVSETTPFNINPLIGSVRYIVLDPTQKVSQIDQLLVKNNRFIILDNDSKMVSVFAINGKFLFKVTFSGIAKLRATEQEIILYLPNPGELRVYDNNGMLKKVRNSGFKGLDFCTIDGATYFFQTSGLSTIDNGSVDYEISVNDENLKLTHFMLPIAEQKRNLSYNAGSNFSINDSLVSFIPSLSNKEIVMDNEKIKEVNSFNFGRLTLTDSLFQHLKMLEDFHSIPYIIDLSNIARTKKYSFYSFSLKGNVGYLLVNNRDKKVCVSGIGSSAGTLTQSQSIIPICSLNNSFINIIHPNHNLNNKQIENINIGNRSDYKFSRNSNCAIMMYDLK